MRRMRLFESTKTDPFPPPALPAAPALSFGLFFSLFSALQPPFTSRLENRTDQAGSISRADVADFVLGAVSEEDFPYLKQAPCISSVGGTSWVKDRSAAARGEMA